MKSSVLNWNQIFSRISKTSLSSRHRTVHSLSNTPPKNENVDHNNQTENATESPQHQTSVEPNTNPNENAQQNPLQTAKSSYSEMFTERVQKSYMDLQQEISESFFSEQTQTKIEHLRLQHQRRSKAAGQVLQKQELERNQLIKQLNQPNTENHDDDITLKKTQVIFPTSKKLPPQQVRRSAFSNPPPWIFHVLVEKQRAFITDAVSFTLNCIFISKTFLLFEKHCNDFYSNPLMTGHLDSFL